MWLLNTKTLELRNFPNTPRNRYAILSHVWEAGDTEYSFQSIKALYEKYHDFEEGPLPYAPEKVRHFCNLAAEEGYEWVWFDTCCIDKTSSSELSEAINSMYPWYEAASVCYAYLYDVPDEDDPFEPGSAFRNSRYHARGWTLQELLTSKHVIFLSASWSFLGTKTILVTPLVERTGIDRDVLLWTDMTWKEVTSVAQRMSWAAHRVTTRSEDRAYSLMGIFGVSMPVIYGEGGERAFLRLQKEIISLCRDQTIFAWGPIHPNFNVAHDNIQRHILSEGRGSFVEPGIGRAPALLATSPADFAHSAHLQPLEPLIHRILFGHPVDHKCTFSADGVSLRLPTSSHILHAHWGEFVHAVALACTTTVADSSPMISIIFLFLSRDRRPHRDDWEDSSQALPFYRVGRMAQDGEGQDHYYRGAMLWLQLPEGGRISSLTLALSDFFRSQLARLVLRRRELQIGYDTSFAFMRSLAPTDPLPPSHYDSYVFEIPKWVFERLDKRHGFEFVHSPSIGLHRTVHGARRFAVNIDAGFDSDEQPPFYILFRNATRQQTLGIVFGVQCRCCVVATGVDRAIKPEFWWLQVFFAPAVLDPKDQTCVLAAVEANEVSQDRDDRRECRRTHLYVQHWMQPAVFPGIDITASAYDVPGSRSLRIWPTFRGMPPHDGDSAPAAMGHFVVVMDLVDVQPAPSTDPPAPADLAS